MKYKILVLLLTTATLLFSACSKSENSPVTTGKPPAELNASLREGGEDDDGPVIVNIIKDQWGHPLQSAYLVFSSEAGMVDNYTDEEGQSVLQLPRFGTWNYSIRYEDEIYLETELRLTDSLNHRTDTLYLD